MAHDVVFVSVSAFNEMTKQERDYLSARLSDPLFMRFFDVQEQAAREQMAGLDPDQEEMTDEKYRQKSRELRMIWQFWSEFRELAQSWAARSSKEK